MNFLELVQKLHTKCGVTGAEPTGLTEQPQEINRLIGWINESWMYIQTAREDWQWMRSTFSFETVSGQAVYTPEEAGITDFGNWQRGNFRNYVTATGTNSEIRMDDEYDYQMWRDVYQFGANRNTRTRPIEVTITPEKYLGLGPVPIDGYTVTGSYFKVPTEMVNATDEPSMPPRFHMAIVYKAMTLYGAYESAPEVYDEGKDEFRRMGTMLGINQRPMIQLAGSLA